VFGYISISDGNPTPLKSGYFFGISGSSFLPSRDLDRWGMVYFRSNVGDALEHSLAVLGVSLADEFGWELFYNFAVTPWFRVTPDVQFINPGLASGQKAVFVGLRSQIKF
jgi:porin